jgi:hypothetical protein
MNKQDGTIVVSILFAVGTAAASHAADARESLQGSNPPKVKVGVNATPEGGTLRSVVAGELVKIDGKYYVVKDLSGKEPRIQLDERTMMNADPKVGDKTRDNAKPQGHAYPINLGSDSTQAGTNDKQTGPSAKSDLSGLIKK